VSNKRYLSFCRFHLVGFGSSPTCDRFRLLARYRRLPVRLSVGDNAYFGWKLYRRVLRRALPILFFRHFCCRMYRAPKADSSAKLQIRNYSCWLRLFQTMVCRYTERRTQYDRLSQQQLSFLLNLWCTMDISRCILRHSSTITGRNDHAYATVQILRAAALVPHKLKRVPHVPCEISAAAYKTRQDKILFCQTTLKQIYVKHTWWMLYSLT